MIAAFIAACGGGQPDADESRDAAPIDSAHVDTSRHETRDDRVRMMMIEDVPLGLTYDEVRNRVEGLGEPEPELDGIAPELTEVRAATRILGHDAALEFNFRRDTLYSYYFHVDAASCGEAEALYEEIVDIYSSAWGQARQEAEDEGGYTWRSSSWTLPDDIEASQTAITLGRQGETCRVGWGFD